MGFRLISNFAQVTSAIEKSLPKQCLRACHEVRNEWVWSLTGTRTGRYYRIPGTHRKRQKGAARLSRAQKPKGGWLAGMETQTGAASLLSTGTGAAGRAGYYRASAAGEAPARRLGDLVRSIRVMPRFEPRRIQARVGSTLDYALYLEYGTENMSPRPSLGPAKDRAMPKVLSIFAEGLI